MRLCLLHYLVKNNQAVFLPRLLLCVSKKALFVAMLRKYQHNIKQSLISEWEKHNSIMVQMPTGTGKTHLIVAVIYEWLKDGKDENVWIVAHRRELVEQIEETVARYGISKEDGWVKVMSIQWLSRHWKDVKDEKPSLIVVDEAHHALAETYKELWLRYPNAKKLGMTATPCRLNRKGFTDLFDTLITSYSIADFIRQGWLSAFDYVSIRPNSEDQRLINNLEKRGANGDFQVKEMDTVLNKRPSIERLYESVRQYANGKKGIVYAISISHARNIAGYYKEHGMNAVAIDSKTPAKVRKLLVEDFKKGKVKVLVNVDVFSEGFDCPDVEFIQMARPTLSLAKYLQQVGRGLRKVDGKEYCVMIDNVGLYHLFGLPTAYRDWQAMFEGRMAGKGYLNRARTAACNLAQPVETVADNGLELVVSHDGLMEYLDKKSSISNNKACLKAYKDGTSGLYGLKRGSVIACKPQFVRVLDIQGNLAVVRKANMHIAVVDGDGNIVMDLSSHKSAKFIEDRLLAVTDKRNNEQFIDLYSGHFFIRKPKVLAYGGVQLLESGGIYYSRTRELYKSRKSISGTSILTCGHYVRIVDYFSLSRCRQVNEDDALWGHDCVCLLAGDHDTWYHYCGMLAGGGIVIEDKAGMYYLVEDDGKGKRYIACEHPKAAEEDFDVVIPQLKAEAKKRLAGHRTEEWQNNERKRKARLDGLKAAVPFKSGLKWGLQLDGRIIVPPIYRSIKSPVGCYCAVEDNPNQWGIIMVDGKVVVETRYTDVEIKDDGTALLTIIPGNVKTVKLHK